MLSYHLIVLYSQYHGSWWPGVVRASTSTVMLLTFFARNIPILSPEGLLKCIIHIIHIASSGAWPWTPLCRWLLFASNRGCYFVQWILIYCTMNISFWFCTPLYLFLFVPVDKDTLASGEWMDGRELYMQLMLGWSLSLTRNYCIHLHHISGKEHYSYL